MSTSVAFEQSCKETGKLQEQALSGEMAHKRQYWLVPLCFLPYRRKTVPVWYVANEELECRRKPCILESVTPCPVGSKEKTSSIPRRFCISVIGESETIAGEFRKGMKRGGEEKNPVTADRAESLRLKSAK